VVKNVYAQRKRFIRSRFERIGFSGNDAEIRTRLMPCYFSWEPNMYAKESEDKRLQLMELQHELLTKSND